MNQAQHIWLAIMTELAIERTSDHSLTLYRLLWKHRKAAGFRADVGPYSCWGRIYR
jgi:hypothetical protein